MKTLLRALTVALAVALAALAPVQAGSLLMMGLGATNGGGGGGGSVIQSIHSYSLTLAAGSATGTQTITSVTAAKAMLVWNGVTSDNASTPWARGAVRITLTNSTTVTATRESSSTNSATVSFTVVEFASGVNSIQYGSIGVASGNTTNTATITAVGANAFVMWLGASIATIAGSYTDIYSGVSLTNSTTVTANLGYSPTSTQTTSFVVVDLDATVVSAIQQSTATSTAASTTDTATVTSLDRTKSIVAFGGFTTTAGSATSYNYEEAYTANTTITFTKGAAGATSRTRYFTTVTFASAALAANGVQRGTIALSAQASNTATITSVSTTKAFANWGGFFTTDSNLNNTLMSLALTNATTVTAAFNASGTATQAFEVVEFQ